MCELCLATSRDTCHTILWYRLSHRPPDSSAMGALWPAIRQGPLCSTQPAGRAARARDTRPGATRCGPESPSPPGQPAPAAWRPGASSGPADQTRADRAPDRPLWAARQRSLEPARATRRWILAEYTCAEPPPLSTRQSCPPGGPQGGPNSPDPRAWSLTERIEQPVVSGAGATGASSAVKRRDWSTRFARIALGVALHLQTRRNRASPSQT